MYGDESCFIEAYQNWMTLAKQESRLLREAVENVPLIYHHLCAGMQRLNRSCSFVARNDLWDIYETDYCHWGSTQPKFDYLITGSPLKRSWHPLHKRPNFFPVILDDDRVFHCVRDITWTLSKIPQCFTRFEYHLQSPVQQPVWFIEGQYVREGFKLPRANDYAHLQNFGLHLARRGTWPYDHERPLAIFTAMLESMSDLKSLKLQSDSGQEPNYFTLEHFFSVGKQWLQLTDLTLVGFRIKGPDLSGFFECKCLNYTA